MKILIAYATLSGNTQMIAENLEQYLKEKGHEVTLINQDDADPAQMNMFDYVFLGSSTWGDGEPNPTSEAFLQKLKEYTGDLGSVKFAVFGLGDSSYPNFCGVVTQFEEALSAKQKTVAVESLKIDGYPDDSTSIKIHEWADKAIMM